MRVQPLRRYPAPRYPTAREAAALPGLLAAVPGKWGPGSRLATFLGAGLAAPFLLAGCRGADDSSAPAPLGGIAVDPRETGGGREQSREFLLKVAPLVEDALRMDGRGAFGCVVIDPPTFLSEEEAVGIIRRELAAAGLELAGQGLSIPGVKRPMTTLRYDPKGRAGFHPPAPFEFDGASADGRVAFEYVSHQDFDAWSDGKMPDSTVAGYDLAGVACRLAGELANARAGRPLLAGVFFDPMVHPGQGLPWPEPKAGESRASDEAWREYRAKVKARVTLRASERLRLQVRGFVKFLREQGALPKESTGRGEPGGAAAAEAPDPQWLVELRRKLGKETRFEFVQAPAEEVLKFLAGEAKVKLVIDTATCFELERMVTLCLNKVTVAQALNWVARCVPLEYDLQEDGLHAFSRERFRPRMTKVVYPVGDLVGCVGTPHCPAPEVGLAGRRGADDPGRLKFPLPCGEWLDSDLDRFGARIMDQVWLETWQPEQGAALETADDALVIVQRPEGHRAIAAHLAGLRAAQARAVRVCARFYAVEPGRLGEVERCGRLLAEAQASGSPGRRFHAIRGRNWPATAERDEVFTGALLEAQPTVAAGGRGVTLQTSLGLWLAAGSAAEPAGRLKVFRAPLTARLEPDQPLAVLLGTLADPAGAGRAELVVAVLRAEATPAPKPPPSPEPEPEWKVRLQKALDREVEIGFAEEPFDRCVERIRKSAGVNLVLDPETFGAAGRNLSQPMTLRRRKTTLGAALREVARANRLDCALVEGAVLIARPEELLRRRLERRVYDLRGLAPGSSDFPGPELGADGVPAAPPAEQPGAFLPPSEPLATGLSPGQTMDLVKRTVEPDSWGVGGTAIGESDGRMYVCQTPEAHGQIRKLLAALRPALKPDIRLDAALFALPAGAAAGSAAGVEKAGRLLSRVALFGEDGQRVFAVDGWAWPGGEKRPARLAGAVFDVRPRLDSGREHLVAEARITWQPEGAPGVRLDQAVSLTPGEPAAVPVGKSGGREIVAVLRASVESARPPGRRESGKP